MEIVIHSHRYGLEIVKGDIVSNIVLSELLDQLYNISDDDIIQRFNEAKSKLNRKDKSISIVLNDLIRERLTNVGWVAEPFIFKDKKINATTKDWRLDFAHSNLFSLEVAFNHSSATTVNLLKPVLASELNHVEKQYQTKFGIIITATRDMKDKGGFDGAIGTYEGYVEQCRPLMNQLTIPLIIIGIEAPKSFKIIHKKDGKRKIGFIEKIL